MDTLRPERRIGTSHTVGVLVYRGVTTSEIDAPVRRLGVRLDADVVHVGREIGEVHGVEQSRAVLVTHTPADAPPIDVLVVPGGLGWRQVIGHDDIREWLRWSVASADAVLAISTGSLLIATIGQLEGCSATGHWLAQEELAALGAAVTSERTARDDTGRFVTASGALAALHVVDEIADRVQWSERP